MRGKKTDSEFLSEFIANSVQLGLNTPTEFADHAKKMIRKIEEQIREAEKLKLIRAKLLDVVSTFETPAKVDKSAEIRALSFFKIQQPAVCKHICDILKKSPATVDGFGKKYSTEDVMFGIKQLLENKVIHKTNNLFLRGEMFDEYIKFVLRDG